MMLEDLYRLLRTGRKSFNVERDDVLGQAFFNLGNGQWDIPELRELLASVVPKTQAVVGFEVN